MPKIGNSNRHCLFTTYKKDRKRGRIYTLSIEILIILNNLEFYLKHKYTFIGC